MKKINLTKLLKNYKIMDNKFKKRQNSFFMENFLPNNNILSKWEGRDI